MKENRAPTSASPQQRHPEQLALQEKTQQRHAPVQRGLQHRDVDPGLMIGEHQVMAVGPQLRASTSKTKRVLVNPRIAWRC